MSVELDLARQIFVIGICSSDRGAMFCLEVM